jgi:hypothetical protein
LGFVIPPGTQALHTGHPYGYFFGFGPGG